MNAKTKELILIEIESILESGCTDYLAYGGSESSHIDPNNFPKVIERLTSFIQAITDPENQPNQYGIDINSIK